jgi:hypothetical protein
MLLPWYASCILLFQPKLLVLDALKSSIGLAP